MESSSKHGFARRDLPVFLLGCVVAVVVLGATSIKTTDNIETDQQLVSNATSRTPPIVVQSDMKVESLNADMLDGFHVNAFALAADTYTMDEVDALVAERYAPFVARTGGGTCASSGQTDTDYIVIDSSGTSGDFQVTSVTFNHPIGTTEIILSSSVVKVTSYCVDYPDVINGCYTMETMDFVVVAPNGFELLGAPLADGGIFARRITASSAGTNDIVITVYCDADGDDVRFGIDGISVAGWKQQGETVSASYLEENPFF